MLYLMHLVELYAVPDASGGAVCCTLCTWLICRLYLVHLIYDEVGHLKVAVNHGVHLKIVVIFPKWVDESLGHLGRQYIKKIKFSSLQFNYWSKFAVSFKGTLKLMEPLFQVI